MYFNPFIGVRASLDQVDPLLYLIYGSTTEIVIIVFISLSHLSGLLTLNTCIYYIISYLTVLHLTKLMIKR